MILSRTTPTQYFDIWAPRWHDVWVGGKRQKSPIVLLAVHKVGTHNEVEFTRTKSPRFSGRWYISGEKIKKFNIGTNTAIPCFEVPFTELEVLERKDNKSISNQSEQVNEQQLTLLGEEDAKISENNKLGDVSHRHISGYRFSK